MSAVFQEGFLVFQCLASIVFFDNLLSLDSNILQELAWTVLQPLLLGAMVVAGFVLTPSPPFFVQDVP